MGSTKHVIKFEATATHHSLINCPLNILGRSEMIALRRRGDGDEILDCVYVKRFAPLPA